MARVVLAMSGGVDSSVAAHLLKEQGHEVIGLFMRTGSFAGGQERQTKTCCSVTDALDARAVADRLDIPFYALDFESEFGRIQDRFADEYLAGRTPNPCVLCNIWLKFGRLFDYGRQVGADHVATGHYARIVAGPDGRPRLARAVDRHKDQSYVLFGLRRERLAQVLLPVGSYPKAVIRRMAQELALPVHDKPDSQEICFVPDDDYRAVVRRRRPDAGDTSGPILDSDGRILGFHDGYESYTVGQRRGLGVAVGEARYVLRIDPATRGVTIGPRAALERPGLIASGMNWQIDEPTAPLPCLAQIRARHQAVPASVEAQPGGEAIVRFEQPQPAVAPGQVVTLYDGDLVLGGGWIERPLEPATGG
ncbi:MAG: tRNA-specific 2-thiouridylase MnmA [Isosphaeraceae bacterium]|jgi:tRNA-specific 2-thiouridylase|nr:MAG: tRNA-specific 2-thiouridylase MnmA [Isosphaeraceae bacterium]